MSFARLDHDQGYGMPAHRPYYPPLPTYYRDVRFQLLYFRAEPAGCDRFCRGMNSTTVQEG